MAKQNSNKRLRLIFDLGILSIMIGSLSLFVFGQFFYKESLPNGKLRVTVKVPFDNIEEIATREKKVFFNNVDREVEVAGLVREENYLFITLIAPGEIKGEVYNFNGQRILVNQKAEIHGAYFAQGKVVSVADEAN